MTLIPIEDLRRAEERYCAQQAEEHRKQHEQDVARRECDVTPSLPWAPPAPSETTTTFEYIPRSPFQWEKRMRQSWKNNRSFHPKWEKPARKPMAVSPAELKP
jgi:hypothetical protein